MDTNRLSVVDAVSPETAPSFRWLRDLVLPLLGRDAIHALIIEDEPLIAIEIEDILRNNGYTSFAFAVSADEAVAEAAARCPDLVTSDVRLDLGNGLDAVAEIRRHSAVPVIFITSDGGIVRARLPQSEVVRKPFRAADLGAALDRLAAG